jgi:hypothetical protein
VRQAVRDASLESLLTEYLASETQAQVILKTSSKDVMAAFGEEPPSTSVGVATREPAAPKIVGDTCSICLINYQHADCIRRSHHCEHVFHSHCLLDWLVVENKAQTVPQCPYCRKDVVLSSDVKRVASLMDQIAA